MFDESLLILLALIFKSFVDTVAYPLNKNIS